MNRPTLLVILPIGAMLVGVVLATFYHKYDTSRNLFLHLNLRIEDLSGTGGNIISLQKDPNENIVWIVSGKWGLDVNSKDTTKNTTDTVDFSSNLSMRKADGISSAKVSISNFNLLNSHILEEVATLDGTASLINTANSPDALTGQNRTVPLHIVISNGRTISISSDSKLFHKYFESSPVYGIVPSRDLGR